jgi:SSS family solute:Na+ symporter
MNTLHLSYWDYLSLVVYLLLILYVGYRAHRRTNIADETDFLLANRSLSLPGFVATLVTTWYGGILGIGEFSYSYGIATWVVFGLPYYIFAALFALLLAGKIRAAGQYTIADIFYSGYDKSVGIIASIFILFMTSPAPYILMVAFLLNIMFGWSLLISLIIGTIVSTIYVFFGGFRSVVQTDKLQFVLIYAGFLLILSYLVYTYGGYSFLVENLPESHLLWHGGNSLQYIIVWFFLASWTFIDPGFHQRCAAAKTLKIARKGILVSIIFWFIFDFLTITTGLYAVVVLKGINPMLSYPLLADHLLPPFIKGLFLTGLLAVIMSTIDSFTLLSAITFGRDLIWRIKKGSTIHISYYTRLSLLFTAIISIVLCILFPSVIKLWYVIGSIFIPPMFLPLVTAYFLKFKLTAKLTLVIMILSFVVSLSLLLWGQWHLDAGRPVYLFNLEPFFPGLVTSILFYLVYNIYKRKLLNTKDTKKAQRSQR